MSWTVGGSFVSTAAFTFGRVRDEARHLRERLGPRRPQLIDERRRRHDLALERLLGFPRDADVDQVDRHADRQHREQGARQEDAAAKRARTSIPACSSDREVELGDAAGGDRHRLWAPTPPLRSTR